MIPGLHPLPDLYKILAAGENDDRRLAAHYILRFGGVAEHAVAQVVNWDLVTFDNLGKSIIIALSSSFDP